jgi:hypothetical protein
MSATTILRRCFYAHSQEITVPRIPEEYWGQKIKFNDLPEELEIDFFGHIIRGTIPRSQIFSYSDVNRTQVVGTQVVEPEIHYQEYKREEETDEEDEDENSEKYSESEVEVSVVQQEDNEIEISEEEEEEENEEEDL